MADFDTCYAQSMVDRRLSHVVLPEKVVAFLITDLGLWS